MPRLFLTILLLSSIFSLRAQYSYEDRKKAEDRVLNSFTAIGAKVVNPDASRRFSNAGFPDTTTWRAAALPIKFDGGYVLFAYTDVRNTPIDKYLTRFHRVLYMKGGDIGNSLSTVPTYTNTMAVITVLHDKFIKVGDADFVRYYVLNDNNWNQLGGSDETLRLERNYVFARYGYQFRSDDLRQYFSAFPWYKPQFKNVDNLLTAEDKALIAAIQKSEAGVHFAKPKPAPDLPEQFSNTGQEMTPSVAGFFFAPEEVSADSNYTVSLPATAVAGGYVMGLTCSKKPAANGMVTRTYNYVFWKSGTTGQPVSISAHATRDSIFYPPALIVEDAFFRIGLPRSAKEMNTFHRYEYFVVSGNDLFNVRNTPRAEIAYYKNYLLARNGSTFASAPDIKSSFEKFDWYKPTRDDMSAGLLQSEDESMIWVLLEMRR